MADTLSNLSDSALIDVAAQCNNAMNAHLADYPNVTQQQVDDLKTFKDAFIPELTLHVTKQAEAKAQTAVKDAKRDPVEAQLRMLRNIAKAAGASEAAMAATGIPQGSSEAPSTATVPAAKVDTSERMRHTLSWFDSASPENKRRPRGVIGAEIWMKLDGPPPTDEKECTFLTLDTRTPYTAEYTGDEGGKTAHYMFRWRNRDGSLSAWSETVSATITA